MAMIKSDKKIIDKCFQIEIVNGWLLDIDANVTPIKYTLTHGKKSMSFYSNVTRDLCSRNYSLRLAQGRKQMILPAKVLQAFVEHEPFLSWYDASIKSQMSSNNQSKDS